GLRSLRAARLRWTRAIKSPGGSHPASQENPFSIKPFSIEQRVDVILGDMTDAAVQLRAVQQAGVAFPIVNDSRRVRPDGIDAAPDVHHDRDMVFDEFHRGHHLADALTSEILEIASLEDRNDAFQNFLAEQ